MHYPHPKNKRIKKGSRLVILPDYQGIGLGTKFINIIAEKYNKNKYDFFATCSAKNLIHALNNNNKWVTKRYSIVKAGKKTKMVNTMRKVKTATFKYIGENKNEV